MSGNEVSRIEGRRIEGRKRERGKRGIDNTLKE